MADNSAEDFDLDAAMTETLKDINSRDSENTDEGEEDRIDSEEELVHDNPVGEQEDDELEDKEDTSEESEDGPDADHQESSEELVVEDEDEPKAPSRAPSSWSAKGKAEFSKLPLHIQDEVLKRENDFHNGIQQYKERAEIGDKFSQVVQPYVATIHSKNSTPEATVGNLLNTAYILETADPQRTAQLVMQIAQEYNADMSIFNQDHQPEQKPEYVRQLEQQVAQLSNNIQTQQIYAQQQTSAEVNSSIESFRNELDESGGFAHIYFDDVRDQMADIIESGARQGRQPSLKEAYDAAVWSRPDIRETLLAAQQQQKSETLKRERAQKAQKAKKASGVNLSTKGSHVQKQSSEPSGSIEETMRDTLKNMNSRHD